MPVANGLVKRIRVHDPFVSWIQHFEGRHVLAFEPQIAIRGVFDDVNGVTGSPLVMLYDGHGLTLFLERPGPAGRILEISDQI